MTDPVKFGFILLQGYAGLTKRRVQIIGQTEKRYRIRALERTRLAGRNRFIEAGAEALVPKHAVAMER
jgi:hypothetical protein